MRSIITFVPALACLIGICLVPMLLMHRNRSSTSHHEAGADQESKEVRRLREEVSALRGELAQRSTVEEPDP
jgi:hypothetical protein